MMHFFETINLCLNADDIVAYSIDEYPPQSRLWGLIKKGGQIKIYIFTKVDKRTMSINGIQPDCYSQKVKEIKDELSEVICRDVK